MYLRCPSKQARSIQPAASSWCRAEEKSPRRAHKPKYPRRPAGTEPRTRSHQWACVSRMDARKAEPVNTQRRRAQPLLQTAKEIVTFLIIYII